MQPAPMLLNVRAPLYYPPMLLLGHSQCSPEVHTLALDKNETAQTVWPKGQAGSKKTVAM